MPSPFPGMDPWLEGPHWMTVHNQLGSEIARQLSPRILPKYLAMITEYQVVDEEEEIEVRTSRMYPDVAILEREGALAVAESAVLTAPLTLANEIPHTVPHIAVEIRDVENMDLVTAIEILSPANKRGVGHEEYLAKRTRILRGAAHLLEIDLLRQGKRIPLKPALPAADYIVVLSRADRRPAAETWPISLHEPLPMVPVPLLPGDNDVPLDIQLAFTTIYDLLGYRYLVNYRNPPHIPLAGTDSEWSAEILRRAGYRA